MYKHFLKRLLDVIIVFCALAVIWPILLTITIWLHFANKGAGAFFYQERPGKNGRIFRVIKFKSMTDERDKNGKLLPDAQRITKVGRFIRNTSLDELPQLINVLKGDMALVGPRPLDIDYLQFYSAYHSRRHEVRPGITGWAQVNGRNNTKFSEKFEYDVWYVDHITMWLDIRIIYLTIMNVLKRSDIGTGSSNMKNVDDLHFLDRCLGNLREWGSEYHSCTYFPKSRKNNITNLFHGAFYYGNGRMAIADIFNQCGYKRLWLPEYFCYEVVEYLKKHNIDILFYKDNPLVDDDDKIISDLPYLQGDILLRVNYFGLRAFRDNSNIPIPVIEDHTHDFLGEWAQNSNADWCIVSLRKSLPIASGAMVWSPKKKTLHRRNNSIDCEKMAALKFKAMYIKWDYLNYGRENKEEYLNLFYQAEEQLSLLPVCSIDANSMNIISKLDLMELTRRKKDNFKFASEMLSKAGFKILKPENDEKCNPFSLILLFENHSQRNTIRDKLITHNIYPSILWNIPRNDDSCEVKIAHCMLSIHCDARYTQKAIEKMCERIINLK